MDKLSFQERDEKILAKEGWQVDCWSPFEIYDEDGSKATGAAADIVLAYCKEQAYSAQRCFGDVEIGGFFYEEDAADGVYMLKTPVATGKDGKKFNCITVNASPDEHIQEYTDWKDDKDFVYLKDV